MRVATFFRDINVEHLGTLNMDTPAAIAAFENGEGGIYPTGTWMIGSFQHEAETPGRPLYKSYAVFPYPRLWGATRRIVSGHSLGRPGPKANAEAARSDRALLQVHGEPRLRLGPHRAHPRIQVGAGDPRFEALPHRSDIAPLASMGRPLPGYVLRQSAIEGIVGEEAAAAFTGQKTVPQALSDAERRVDVLLAQVSRKKSE